MAKKIRREKKQIGPYGVSSDAKVVYISDHEHFSNYVVEFLIKPALQQDQAESTIPAIVSVCAYTPSFFYRIIKQKVERKDKKQLTEFEHLHDSEIFDKNREKEFNTIQDVFNRAANIIFPHFAIIAKAAEKAVRLCVFCRDDDPEVEKQLYANAILGNDKYIMKYANMIPAAHTYAFFKWLNSNVRCYILPPAEWESWGFSKGRDFALLNSCDIVEYHDQWNSAIIVENVNDNWNNFVRISSLISSWKKKTGIFWDPMEFMTVSYKLVFPEKIINLIENAAILEDTTKDQDKPKFRNRVLTILPRLKTAISYLKITDISVIMKDNKEVEELLNQQLNINQNPSRFEKAVNELLKAAESMKPGNRRTKT